MLDPSSANVRLVNETLLLDLIYKGEPGILPRDKKNIDASYLRKHILEIDPLEGPKLGRAVRWEIDGAVFSSRFDLSDGCRPNGAPLPALSFKNCEFHRGFCADAAKLERLSFYNCGFSSDDADPTQPGHNFISLRNCRIQSDLRIRNVYAGVLPAGDSEGIADSAPTAPTTPATSNQEASQSKESRIESAKKAVVPKHNSVANIDALLWVDAFAITVGTNVDIRNCFFKAPRNHSSKTQPEPRYALDLSTADIHCDLQLQPNVFLEGGLKMRDARVGGTVWAQALYATDGEDDNSRQQIATVRGEPRSAFRADRARIRGSFALNAIDEVNEQYKAILDRIYGADSQPDRVLNSKHSANYLQNRDGRRSWCVGKVNLEGLELDGYLILDGAHIRGTEYSSLSLIAARIDKHFHARAFVPRKLPDNPESSNKLSVQVPYIDLSMARIAGSCALDVVECVYMALSNAFIGGTLDIEGDTTRLSGKGLDVGRDTVLALKGVKSCDLSGISIKGNLDISYMRFVTGESWPRGSGPSKGVGINNPKPFSTMWLRDADIGHALIASAISHDISVTKQSLDFYPRFTLWQITLPATSDTSARVASFLCKNHDGSVRLLTGLSAPIHETNAEICPQLNGHEQAEKYLLNNEEQAKEYLRFFCAYVWGPMGAFQVIEDSEALPKNADRRLVYPLTTLPSHETDGNDKSRSNIPRQYLIKGLVRYDAFLFDAQFKVTSSGMVEMLNDTPKESIVYQENERKSYQPPFRIKALNDTPDFDSKLSHPKPTSLADFEGRIPGWIELLMQDRLAGVKLDLQGAKCGRLRDADGKVWECGPGSELEGFTYTTLRSEVKVHDELEVRLKWLAGHQPGPFRAQPYKQLAKAFRERGDDDAAKEVEAEKIKLAAYDRADDTPGRFFMLWWWFYGIFFKFGISPGRALATLLIVWAMGVGAIQMLDESELLKANLNVAAQPALVEPQGRLVPVVRYASVDDLKFPLACHKAISPFLYAAELMIPVLNLHQESRCELREEFVRDEKDPNLKFWGRTFHVRWHFLIVPRTWEYLRAFYLLLASVVTSLALLTFSGIARRWEQ